MTQTGRRETKPSDGGPSSYYDFLPGWVTFNDFMEYKSLNQWGAYALHMKDIGKALCRFGVKEGTTESYDARKIVYSGLRLLIMLEGRDAAAKELKRLADDPQFKHESFPEVEFGQPPIMGHTHRGKHGPVSRGSD